MNSQLNVIVKNLIDAHGIENVQSVLNDIIKSCNKEEDEPILNADNMKFTTYPITYQHIWDNVYKIQMASFWTAEEIDFSNDYDDFLTLNKNEQHFIEMILAFFAASDGIVNFNLGERFTREIKNTEILYAYQFQIMMENIHCVSGDTRVLTIDGYENIESVCGLKKHVWNGFEFSEVDIVFTGLSVLYQVELSNGMMLKCTPEHKWFVNGDKTYTKDLVIGDVINDFKYPIINDKCSKLPDDVMMSKNLDYLRGIQLLITTSGQKNTCIVQVDDIYILSYTDDNVITISNIIVLGDEVHKTYCFNEPLRHAGVFNGILTGQSEVYSMMLDNIVKDIDRRMELFNAIETVDSIKLMSDWAFKWIESPLSFAHRVVAFVIVEGVFFSGMFAALFWMKKHKNKNREANGGTSGQFMSGLMSSNQLIARDEGQHAINACEVYKLLKHRLSQTDVEEIFKDAVPISKKFMEDAIQVKLIGMNFDKMCRFIEYISDRLIMMLGYSKIYKSQNPFKFMEGMGLHNKTNFFETRPTEYQGAHVKNESNKRKIVLMEEGF